MTEMTHAFEVFPSLHRYSKENVVITEKIDGANAQVFIDEYSTIIRAGSRNRWITPEDDNFGFARFVHEHRDWMLKYLGPGRHYGEWWGNGIQRTYGMDKKCFSLFNAGRWNTAFEEMRKGGVEIPDQIRTVPVLEVVRASEHKPMDSLQRLLILGSQANPGFRLPEGIVCYHTLTKTSYKVTYDYDQKTIDKHKWESKIDQSRGQPEGH